MGKAMSDPQDASRIADREAAEWHVRLGERPVTAATLADFKAWRASAANAEAYYRLETLWRTTGSLSGDADIQALTRDTLKASRPRASRSGKGTVLPAILAATAVAVAAVGLFVWLPSRGVYSTTIGGRDVVQLADGSRITLDTDTRLRVRFEASERRIFLERGQALFVVAHDADRPFRVAAGGAAVTALGTTFDVRREADGARVTLVVGSVAVTDTADGKTRSWRLSPGQQLETEKTNPAPRTVDAALATSWSEGRLVFRRTPLREAVAEVNRYLPHKITLDAGPAEAVAVNGVFTAGDRDAFVAAATDLFGLKAQNQADGSVRLTASSVGG